MNPLGKLQLSLFDWLMPSEPLGQPRAAPQPTKSSPPTAPSLPAPTAPQLPPPVAVQSVEAESAVVAHPLANRQARIDGHVLHYHLRRSSRKTIGLQVGAEGLCVTAPRWALVGDIEQVVREKGPWVLEKMRQMRERDMAHLQKTIVWQDGVCLPYLGGHLRVRLSPQARAEGLVTDGESSDTPSLHLRLPMQASSTQIREKTQAWLMKRAREHFAQRLDYFAPQLGVRWTQLRLSQAKTRWGSANLRGVISLNWRLIHHAGGIIDYVVVHELSHLLEMNHSAAFWETVASVMPDYERQRHALKKDNLPPW